MDNIWRRLLDVARREPVLVRSAIYGIAAVAGVTVSEHVMVAAFLVLAGVDIRGRVTPIEGD